MDIENVQFELAMELGEGRDREVLGEFLRRFPQHRAALERFYCDFILDDDEHWAEREDESWVSRA